MTTDAKNLEIQVGDLVALRGRVIELDGPDIVVARLHPQSRAEGVDGGEDLKLPGDGFRASLIRLRACEVEVTGAELK